MGVVRHPLSLVAHGAEATVTALSLLKQDRRDLAQETFPHTAARRGRLAW